MYKSKLQEFCHKRSWDLPTYATEKDGPDHCPKFTTTVSVNGVPFQSPPDVSKSSKESQNMAAKLAFDFLTSSANSSVHSPPSPSVPSPLPLSGNVQTAIAIDTSPPEILQQKHAGNVQTAIAIDASPPEILQQKHAGNVQTAIAIDTSPPHKDDSMSKDLLHLYKSRLQHYAQKNNLPLPEYSCEFDGPPHSRRFRASVMIDGKTYKSSEYYPTLKDAEHAAAKTAVDSLSVVEIQENDGLYKTLLHELAQKEGFHFPSYTTTRSGPSHMPTFVSSVEVGGKIYQGGECKTKKQSEMNAAKVAYNKLMERTPVSLQPINADSCQHIVPKITQENHMKRAAGEGSEMDRNASILSPPGSQVKEPLEMPSPSLGYVVTNDSLQNIQPKKAHAVRENLDSGVEGDEKNAKRYRSSSSQNMCHHFPEALPTSCELSNAPPSYSMPSELVKSDEARPAEGSNPPGSKVLIFRRGSTMEIPEGASILCHYDEKWVAVRVDLDQDQKV